MNGTNYEVPHCGAFSTPHSHPSWAQIFASGSCFQIWQYYCFIYFHFQILRKKSRRQECLDSPVISVEFVYQSGIFWTFLKISVLTCVSGDRNVTWMQFCYKQCSACSSLYRLPSMSLSKQFINFISKLLISTWKFSLLEDYFPTCFMESSLDLGAGIPHASVLTQGSFPRPWSSHRASRHGSLPCRSILLNIMFLHRWEDFS